MVLCENNETKWKEMVLYKKKQNSTLQNGSFKVHGLWGLDFGFGFDTIIFSMVTTDNSSHQLGLCILWRPSHRIMQDTLSHYKLFSTNVHYFRLPLCSTPEQGSVLFENILLGRQQKSDLMMIPRGQDQPRQANLQHPLLPHQLLHLFPPWMSR